MKKAVVIYSGGVDSYTLLMMLIHKGEYDEVHAISVDYGQRHDVELTYARRVCKQQGIDYKVVDLSGLRDVINASALTSSRPVPHGHYESENMKQTVVPNRNAILIMIAAGYCVTIGAEELFLGVHSGDHHIYADCRPSFISAMNGALAFSNSEIVNLHAPFIDMPKSEIMRIGAMMRLDYGNAWTCYDPKWVGGISLGDVSRPVACGLCGSCTERLEAVQLSGALDTMEYANNDD